MGFTAAYLGLPQLTWVYLSRLCAKRTHIARKRRRFPGGFLRDAPGRSAAQSWGCWRAVFLNVPECSKRAECKTNPFQQNPLLPLQQSGFARRPRAKNHLGVPLRTPQPSYPVQLPRRCRAYAICPDRPRIVRLEGDAGGPASGPAGGEQRRATRRPSSVRSAPMFWIIRWTNGHGVDQSIVVEATSRVVAETMALKRDIPVVIIEEASAADVAEARTSKRLWQHTRAQQRL